MLAMLPDPIPPFPREAQLPPFSPTLFREWGFRKRINAMARAWAVQGNAMPFALSVLYIAKAFVFLYLFHSKVRHFDSAHNDFARFLLYCVAFEVLGFGCGAGPNSGKMFPPFTAGLHFLLIGSARVSHWFSSTRRYGFEVGLFVIFLGMIFRICYFPDGLHRIDLAQGLFATWLFLSLRDQTFFLACRSEVFMSMFAVGIFSSSPASSLAAMQAVQLGIWFWAGVAKHGVWWPYVLPVMISCNPFLSLLPFGMGLRLKQSLYVDYPNNLNPSLTTRIFAASGAILEMIFPLLLAIVRLRLEQ